MPTKLIVDNVSVPIKRIQFSDGGTNIKLEVPQQLIDYPPSAYYSISVDLDTPVDNYLWEILLLDDAIQNTFGMSFKRRLLHLPYLPHGRADRVFEKGNPFPLKLFLDAISWMFDEIFLTDPHSDYYKIFQGCDSTIQFTVKTQHQCFIEVVGNKIKSGDVLIAPDKGSLNKIYQLQQALEAAGFIFVERRSATSSAISDFPFFPLDLDSDGKKRKGEESMYVEAIKPRLVCL
jgi:ribose-phosphate pyrophosphokinase